MMLRGLGDTATTTTETGTLSSDPGFVAGMEAWESPTTAFNQIGSVFSGLSTLPMYALGFFLVPVAVVGIAMSFMGGKGRR